ncbi:DHA2 family efflux MFS transporter permease subunit [Rhodoblastus acidophilus]|uniref:DHA2 family efflux MFS transporter permease subunit n=1 Tax=Candidatus Rhodoblastus alkanivorans TaxID=2954117 RepID=A0ABS9ZCK4_9HYPH|nr:DHA2 family efflux MFS transporter permease subunit [Candidatus Rhodoblastus alkanivorans]MCI4677840.1 DHA2 family efflux MFS transporter permease subunit [Candidatus Rhodoblastus alkanivorans]MCI4684661.1 DHA2 family efflux MFS transporter permease subunit [Candidatus Rhodoblastus alkanivorans]MDI4641983.1 DHA2 family efflux MFS transporter permease subunit [Rhodoblastus acidophilus]
MSGSTTPDADEPQFSARRFAAFLVMVFGMFMAILDIQVVSASLATIQAGLSTSADEVAWVQTAYLVAEVVMIPLSGFLSRAFSTRVTFTVSAAGFTLMSLFCSLATNINQMIVWRALQGFIGGAMIPTVFSAAYSIFPRNKTSLVAAIIGLVATLAPTIGPTVGGYLTDLFSWRWLFLINIGPGVVVALTAWLLIDFDGPDLRLLRNFDWIGLVSMAFFLGALEYLLEEGPAKNWFDDGRIVWAAALSSSGALVFFWRAFAAENPIVDLRTFADRNFWTGSLASFVLGIGLYGLTYVYPIYLARVRGFSAQQIGETMFLTGLCQFIAAPVVGRLLTRIDLRLMIGLGFLGFAWGAAISSGITNDWGYDQLIMPQILRGFSLMFMMVPINNLALGTLAPAKLKNASGLFNVTRNLGGAVGLAIINTALDKRFDLHFERLRETLAWGNGRTQEFITGLTALYGQYGDHARLAATRQLAALARREATVMALADVFLGLALLFLLMAGLAPFMRRPAAAPPPGAGHR